MDSLPGVSADQLKVIRGLLAGVIEPVCTPHTLIRIYAFGSRVEGGYRPTSDLDLLIEGSVGKEPLSLSFMGRLREAFEESHLPFKVDLLFDSQLPDHVRLGLGQTPKRLLFSRGINI